MAKVNGPAMSLSAAGSISQITYQRTLQRIVRAIAKPVPYARNSRPASPAQLAVRADYRLAIAGWQALTEPEKSDWNVIGAVENISGWNAYLRDWMLAPAPGTIWDGGATIWDGGATTWD